MRDVIMATGSVKWFNNAKGYGFVRSDTGGDDLFVHYSYITMDGYKTLKAGQFVQFDILASGNGFHAINLKVMASEGAESHSINSPTELKVDVSDNLQST